MTLLFDQKRSNKASSYLPRKMLRDSNYGLLGTVTAFFTKQDIDIWGYEDFSKSTLKSGFINIDLEDFSETFKQMESLEGIFDLFYRNKFGEFIVLIDSIWVFLYLCKENNFSNEQVLSEINRPYLWSHRRSWNLLKQIDIEMINKFDFAYKSIKE